jgi:hypothetical protein
MVFPRKKKTKEYERSSSNSSLSYLGKAPENHSKTILINK